MHGFRTNSSSSYWFDLCAMILYHLLNSYRYNVQFEQQLSLSKICGTFNAMTLHHLLHFPFFYKICQ